jgi:hypothetical protein
MVIAMLMGLIITLSGLANIGIYAMAIMEVSKKSRTAQENREVQGK